MLAGRVAWQGLGALRCALEWPGTQRVHYGVSKGLQPDAITYNAVIRACERAGWQRGHCRSSGQSSSMDSSPMWGSSPMWSPRMQCSVLVKSALQLFADISACNAATVIPARGDHVWRFSVHAESARYQRGPCSSSIEVAAGTPA